MLGREQTVVLLWLRIVPHTNRDQEKLGVALGHLMAHDGSLAVKSGADGAVMIGAPSEDQLEAIVTELVRRFGVAAAVKSLEIAYKETLTRAADGESEYAVPLGGRGQYAHVKLRVEPGEPGSGCVFDFRKAILGDAIPERMISSVEEGIAEAIYCGVLSGYPIDDIRLAVYDGSYDDVASSEAAFKIAGRLAFIDAARRAKPILLEPIMTVSVMIPHHHESRVMDGLRARGAGFQSFGEEDAEHSMMTISTLVPLSRMFGYGAELTAQSWGHGTFSMAFSHYAPAILSEDDGDRAADVRAPLRPRTPPLILRASVPEPRD
jgi:elongation factor G